MFQDTLSPLDLVRQFLKSMEPLDYETALKLVSDDCKYTNPPPFGVVIGSAGIRAVLEPFFAPTLENEFTVIRQSASGSTVFLKRLDRHRLADKWVELPVTGIFEVKSGLITCWRDYFDTATIMSQWPTA
jgi:limonene-1,2-epoxide hydrolase